MTVDFYSQPTFASGGQYRVYNSSRTQNGSGILSSIASFLVPMGKRLLSSFGKKAAAKGAEVLTNVAADALRGQRVGESIKRRARDAALDVLEGAVSKKLKQNGVKRVRRPVSKTKRKRVKVPRGNLF